MSVLLYVVGAIAVMVGVGMVGFGIPINEFSFGNTLIGAGITAATGGLIILALGVVAGQLHRLAETLAARPPARPGRSFEASEIQSAEPQAVPAAPASPRMPPPARPKSEPFPRDVFDPRTTSPAAQGPLDEQATSSFAPSLRNPEAPPLAVEDDVSLSPDSPRSGGRGPAGPNGRPDQAHPFPQAWRAPPREVPPPNFETMWPADQRPLRANADQPPISSRQEGTPREPVPPSREPASPPGGPRDPMAPLPGAETTSAAEPPLRAVAVLKSGVVDGMGYTLYVDGSIEAELPQGTLRFASIEDLRAHLEKNN